MKYINSLRKAIRVLSLVLLIALFIQVNSSSAYACLYDTAGKSASDLEKDIKYWRQGYVPNTGSETITGNPGSDTIGAGACSHFSMSYALVKMGILNPSNGDTPMTHIKKAREKNAFLTTWGYFDFNRVSELYPDVSYEGRDPNVEGLDGKSGLTYVKGLMNKGFYVVAIVSTPNTNGHCIFFDGINEDGTTSIGDSAFGGITWEEYYGKTSTTFAYVELLKCKGKDFGSQPSIYDSNSLKKVSTEDVVKFNKLVSEYELTGMPRKSNLKNGIIKPKFTGLNSLTQKEIDVVQQIKDTKEADKLSLFDICKLVISILGFILIIYGLLLGLAYLFDRVNPFINISLVSALTLGHIKVLYKDDFDCISSEETKKKGYVSAVKLFIVVVILIAFGSLMISGYLSYLIYLLISSKGGIN